ncbi:hypothetical protein ACROYT_G005005 [Oculina patagonica]
MRLSVRFNGNWWVVPCGEGEHSIQWLIDETIRRSSETETEKLPITSQNLEAVLAQSGGKRALNDAIKHVLNDSDFVHIFDKGTPVETCRSLPESILYPLRSVVKLLRMKFVELDGCSLSTETLVALGEGKLKIKLAEKSEQAVNKSRKLLDGVLRDNKVVYGVTTGFGKFATVVIPPEELQQLQENVIRSHAAGVGPPLSTKHTRMLFALRINVLAKGYSGISLKTLKQLIAAFNESCLPWVPEQGTVGASGDLAPLSHLALGLMGEGQMWSPRSGWADAGMGVALINGTQLITSLGAEAIERSRLIAKQADVIAAMSLEVLKGTTRAFDALIQEVRPHVGQRRVAERLRSLLHSRVYPSEIAESHRFCKRVQDAYTLRCCPQVHGVVNDTIDFVQDVITTEMNSATDNPVLDYLAIGIHELASMSERRMERLVNPENKVLCHPSSVDSLPTSAGQEDHVSMGGFAARKAIKVVENVEKVLAIELLIACQGIDFLRPLKTTEPLEAVHSLVRKAVKYWDKDRYMAADIEAAIKIVKEGKVWEVASPFMTNYLNSEASQQMPSNVSSPTASVLSASPPLAKKIKLIQE